MSVQKNKQELRKFVIMFLCRYEWSLPFFRTIDGVYGRLIPLFAPQSRPIAEVFLFFFFVLFFWAASFLWNCCLSQMREAWEDCFLHLLDLRCLQFRIVFNSRAPRGSPHTSLHRPVSLSLLVSASVLPSRTTFPAAAPSCLPEFPISDAGAQRAISASLCPPPHCPLPDILICIHRALIFGGSEQRNIFGWALGKPPSAPSRLLECLCFVLTFGFDFLIDLLTLHLSPFILPCRQLLVIYYPV